MGSDWKKPLTPNPSPEGRGEQTTLPKARKASVSLSLRERAGVRVLECGTYQERALGKLDAVVWNNLGVLGYGE